MSIKVVLKPFYGHLNLLMLKKSVCQEKCIRLTAFSFGPALLRNPIHSPSASPLNPRFFLSIDFILSLVIF